MRFLQVLQSVVGGGLASWLPWEHFAWRREVNILLPLQGQTRSEAQGFADATMTGKFPCSEWLLKAEARPRDDLR